MKYIYPVIFTKEDGQYLVSVPDLSGCYTFGSDLQEAVDMARDAMAMWLCIAEDKKEEIPEANLDVLKNGSENEIIYSTCLINNWKLMLNKNEERKNKKTRIKR